MSLEDIMIIQISWPQKSKCFMFRLHKESEKCLTQKEIKEWGEINKSLKETKENQEKK